MTFHRKKYIAAEAGFLLLFALTAGVLWFLFQPKSQIILAAAGTYKDSEWVPVLQESQFLKQDDISVRVKWHSGAAAGNLNLAFAGEETEISFRTGVLGTSIDMQGILSEDILRLQIPVTGDMVYTHSLTEETPFFDKLFGKRNAEGLDQFLKKLSGFRWKKKQEITFSSKDFAGILKDVSVERAKSEKYEIDGKEVSCRGFSLDISGGIQRVDAGFIPEEMYVYLYRNKLAAVRVKYQGDIWELRFLGGKNRDSKIMFVKEGELLLTVKGEQKGDDFPISIGIKNSEGSRFSLGGELKEDGFHADIRSAEIKGKDVRIEGEVSLTPGAEMEELSGDTMDLEHLPEVQKQILIAVFRVLRIS